MNADDMPLRDVTVRAFRVMSDGAKTLGETGRPRPARSALECGDERSEVTALASARRIVLDCPTPASLDPKSQSGDSADSVAALQTLARVRQALSDQRATGTAVGRRADRKSAIRRRAAKPQAKERGQLVREFFTTAWDPRAGCPRSEIGAGRGDFGGTGRLKIRAAALSVFGLLSDLEFRSSEWIKGLT